MINIGKYGNIVGKVELNVGGFDKELSPKVGDGRKLLKILSKGENNRDKMFDDFSIFVGEIVSRDYPPENDVEREELDMFIDRNLMSLFNEFMVIFGISTKEEIAKSKKELLQLQKPEKVE